VKASERIGLAPASRFMCAPNPLLLLLLLLLLLILLLRMMLPMITVT
jgi:hypothetical protein